MNTETIKTTAAKIIIWIVDDDIDVPEVIGPFDDCLATFITDSFGIDCPAEDVNTETLVKNMPLDLLKILRWKKVFRIPAKFAKKRCFCDREVEIAIFALGQWNEPNGYLSRGYSKEIKIAFWPNLVFTDLYDGTRSVLNSRDQAELLPGVKLALKCDALGIPCIALTSEKSTLENFDVLDGRKNIYPVPRDRIGATGKGIEILKHRLSENLFRSLWIPEFRLTVRASLNSDEATYKVIFESKGEIVSETNVTTLSYAYLYIWAHSSRLARLQNWHDELLRWDSSPCPAVSNPPTKKEGGHDYQVSVVVDDLFERRYWLSRQNEIYYEGGKKTRPHRILNANILHLPVPQKPGVPACLNHDWIGKLLKQKLHQVLPPDGYKWLKKTYPKRPLKCSGIKLGCHIRPNIG